jgi:hypothetical protein
MEQLFSLGVRQVAGDQYEAFCALRTVGGWIYTCESQIRRLPRGADWPSWQEAAGYEDEEYEEYEEYEAPPRRPTARPALRPRQPPKASALKRALASALLVARSPLGQALIAPAQTTAQILMTRGLRKLVELAQQGDQRARVELAKAQASPDPVVRSALQAQKLFF